jgi:hypothetical protein
MPLLMVVISPANVIVPIVSAASMGFLALLASHGLQLMLFRFASTSPSEQHVYIGAKLKCWRPCGRPFRKCGYARRASLVLASALIR